MNSRFGGAHLGLLEAFVSRTFDQRTGAAVGRRLTIADPVLWDIVDLHMRFASDEITHNFPILHKHHGLFKLNVAVQRYLRSDRRKEKVNGNGKG